MTRRGDAAGLPLAAKRPKCARRVGAAKSSFAPLPRFSLLYVIHYTHVRSKQRCTRVRLRLSLRGRGDDVVLSRISVIARVFRLSERESPPALPCITIRARAYIVPARYKRTRGHKCRFGFLPSSLTGEWTFGNDALAPLFSSRFARATVTYDVTSY